MPSMVTGFYRNPLTNPGAAALGGMNSTAAKVADPADFALFSIANSFSKGIPSGPPRGGKNPSLLTRGGWTRPAATKPSGSMLSAALLNQQKRQTTGA